MVDDGLQPLSPVNQGLPINQGVISSVDDISVKVEQRGDMGLDKESTLVNAKQGMGLDSHLHKLDPERVAEALIKHWPNLTAASLSLGMSHGVLHWHKAKRSPWFMSLFEQAKQVKLDKIKTVMVDCAMEPKGFLDRAMTLRAYEPDVFNPARKIIVEGYKMTQDEADRRSKVLESCVDATIVNAYTTRKERAQAKREGSSLLPSGETEGGGSGESKP
jgi:hypothetical protein